MSVFRLIQDESGKDGEPIPEDDNGGGGGGGNGGAEALRTSWIIGLPLAVIMILRR